MHFQQLLFTITLSPLNGIRMIPQETKVKIQNSSVFSQFLGIFCLKNLQCLQRFRNILQYLGSYWSQRLEIRTFWNIHFQQNCIQITKYCQILARNHANPFQVLAAHGAYNGAVKGEFNVKIQLSLSNFFF